MNRTRAHFLPSVMLIAIVTLNTSGPVVHPQQMEHSRPAVSSKQFTIQAISAEPRQDSVPQKLVGAWRLVSAVGTDPTFHFAFDHPTGVIIYDRSGWMSVQIDIKGTRKPFVNGAASGTSEEKASAFDNYIAYYGTYTLDLKEQTVTHHLQDASPPNWRGVNNVRWLELQGNDRLFLIPREDGRGGVIERKNATFKLLWERIK